MTRETFINLTAGQKWTTVEDILKKLDDENYWGESFESTALQEQKKVHIRRMMRQLKDDNGWPLFANIVVRDKDGAERNIYKQERLFTLPDYEQTVSHHVTTAMHHIKMARGYRNHAYQRHGVQLPLPFDFHD